LNEALIIINPNAGKQRVHRDWPEISRLLQAAGLEFKHVFTEGSMDAARFAAEALGQGIRRLVMVGGDGTLNEVVHGLMQASPEITKEICLGLIPVGTGNDWTRMYGIPTDYKSAIDVIAAGHTVMQDVGLVRYQHTEGPKERWFVNVAGVGLDAEVVFDTNARKADGRGGKIAYLMSLLKAMFRYSALEANISIDGASVFNGKLYSANIGVCRFSGGGMQQVPAAIPDDGLFDVTIIRKVGKGKVIMNVKGLYDGSFIKMKEVSCFRGAIVNIESNDPLLLEVDGESLGRPPMEFSIRPLALKVCVPASYVPPSTT
jgi:YegS/Rv2252/BmrU family lipid kinase